MTVKTTVGKGTNSNKEKILSNIQNLDNSQIWHVLNLSLKTMRTYYALENKGIRIDCDSNKAEFDGCALIALYTAEEYLKRSGKKDKNIDALFGKFNTNSEGVFEINESMENIFKGISKIEKEIYPEKGYSGVNLQPKSWESFSLNTGKELIELITDPKGYETKRKAARDFQITQAIDYLNGNTR